MLRYTYIPRLATEYPFYGDSTSILSVLETSILLSAASFCAQYFIFCECCDSLTKNYVTRRPVLISQAHFSANM
jgi:hypothetical protein